MTPTIQLALFLYVCSFELTFGASFSNVIVNGAEVIPLEYIQYNRGLPFAGSQIAQISAAPVESVVPFPSVPTVVSPCVAPCVVPNVAAPFAPANAKIVTYKSPLPNVPVVLTNNDQARGYQYSYAVYDDNTGDKKAQSEQSDGSVVQGQYSFIQPDGIRREVVYTADSLKGFNAVVRNISPEPDSSTEKKPEGEKEEKKEEPSPPCGELKNAEIKEGGEEESAEQSKETVEEAPKSSEEKSAEAPAGPSDVIWNGDIPFLTNGVISYNDIVNCLQAKAQQNPQQIVSPLTYVLLPSLYRPC